MLSVTAVLSILAAKVAQNFSKRACLLLSELSEVFILPRHKVNHHFCSISIVLFAECLQAEVGDFVYIMGEQNEGTRDTFPSLFSVGDRGTH